MDLMSVICRKSCDAIPTVCHRTSRWPQGCSKPVAVSASQSTNLAKMLWRGKGVHMDMVPLPGKDPILGIRAEMVGQHLGRRPMYNGSQTILHFEGAEMDMAVS